jgi:hypothetical protein
MEFLFKDLSAMREPTAEDLRNYYTENSQKYKIPIQVTFSQVFFSIDKHGVDGAIGAARDLVKEGVDPSKAPTLGDGSILSTHCVQCTRRDMTNRFGLDFAEAVINLEPGSWYGPLKSAYGFHAVFIQDYQEAKLLNFNDIIDRIRNDWMFENQKENTRKVYGEIRSRYRVLVEGLPYDADVKG